MSNESHPTDSDDFEDILEGTARPAAPASPASPVPSTQRALSEIDINRAAALMWEELLDPVDFEAATGISQQQLGGLLADPERRAAVRRARMQLQNSGELTRLSAAKDSAEMLGILKSIARNEDLHPSPRLTAAAAVMRAGGTEKPSVEKDREVQSVRITINMGDVQVKREFKDVPKPPTWPDERGPERDSRLTIEGSHTRLSDREEDEDQES